MRDNVVRDKSFAFAVRIVRLYRHLQDNKKEYVLSKQILKSGTSIGAIELIKLLTSINKTAQHPNSPFTINH